MTTMTLEMFFQELARIFDRVPKPEQITVYAQKLRRFAPEQLLEILNKLIEECKTYPKVSEIFKAAELLGYMSVDATKTRIHHWEPSPCPTCHGEGRLCIWWEYDIENRETGQVEIQTVKHVVQYSKSFDYQPTSREFRTIFRCKCAAGDAVSLSKKWPKLSRMTPSRREVWS